MTQDIIALLAAALPLMGSPGPATLSLSAIGSVFGVRRGLRYLLGIVAGTTAVLAMIATGVTGLVLALPAAVPVLTLAALGYIAYLAYRIATAPVLSADARDVAEPSLAGGFLLAIANPKAFAAIGAVYSGSTLLPGQPLLDAAAKVALLTVVIAAVNTAWLALGATFAAHLRNPRTGRAMNFFFAALLVASVAATLLG